MPSNCMFRGKWHSGEMVFGGNDTQSLKVGLCSAVITVIAGSTMNV